VISAVRLASAVLAGSVLLAQAPSMPDRKRLPRFEDFRVPTPIPKRNNNAWIATPRFMSRAEKDEIANHTNRIRDATREGPDFAGHYAIVRWGCGSDCLNFVIVDVGTGEIYDTPFVGASGCPYYLDKLLSYRLDSRLLIVTGSLEIPQRDHTFRDGPCEKSYFEWRGNTLKFLRSIPLRFPENR
jgi:hypothetical protein